MANHQFNNPAHILTEILKFKIENYQSPTVDELSLRCGISSASETQSILNHLEQTGHIDFTHGGRGILIRKLTYDSTT